MGKVTSLKIYQINLTLVFACVDLLLKSDIYIFSLQKKNNNNNRKTKSLEH